MPDKLLIKTGRFYLALDDISTALAEGNGPSSSLHIRMRTEHCHVFRGDRAVALIKILDAESDDVTPPPPAPEPAPAAGETSS